MKPINYTEAFDLTERLDKEADMYFNEMMKFADRIAQESHLPLEDSVGELMEAINDARVTVQKRIMEVYAIIAREDVQDESAGCPARKGV